jgi:hypothetical protein
MIARKRHSHSWRFYKPDVNLLKNVDYYLPLLLSSQQKSRIKTDDGMMIDAITTKMTKALDASLTSSIPRVAAG